MRKIALILIMATLAAVVAAMPVLAGPTGDITEDSIVIGQLAK